MSRAEVQKLEELLGMQFCPECHTQMVPYAKSFYLLKCESCSALYDDKLNRFGPGMNRLAKEELKKLRPDVYEVSLMTMREWLFWKVRSFVKFICL